MVSVLYEISTEQVESNLEFCWHSKLDEEFFLTFVLIVD